MLTVDDRPFFDVYDMKGRIVAGKTPNQFIGFGEVRASAATVAAKFYFVAFGGEMCAQSLGEAEMYKQVTKNPEISNCIKLVGHSIIGKDEFYELAPYLVDAAPPRDDFMTVCVIITEFFASAVPLYLYKFETSGDLASIVCQGVDALALFEEFGYQHNDLHLNNILVDLAPAEKLVRYKDRVLQIKHKVLVFDWDMGFSLVADTDFCHLKEYGPDICHPFNPKVDIYLFMRGIYESTKHLPDMSKDFKLFYADFGAPFGANQKDAFCDDHNPGTEATEGLVSEYVFGRLYVISGKDGKPLPPGEPACLKNPSELVSHDYFSTLPWV